MFRRRRVFGVLVVVVVLSVHGNVPADAAPIMLDQVFLGGVGGTSGNDPLAQTFTVGIGGILSSVAVNIFGSTDVTMDIRFTTVGGTPLLSDDAADQLGRVTVTPPPFNFALVSADLSPFHILVTPGERLAIVLQSSGVMNWRNGLDQDATYTGGKAFAKTDAGWKTLPEVFLTLSDADFQFETFVQPVPEPSTLALVGLGLACCWRRVRAVRP